MGGGEAVQDEYLEKGNVFIQEMRSVWLFRSNHATDFGVWVPLQKLMQYYIIFIIISFSKLIFLEIHPSSLFYEKSSQVCPKLHLQ